MTGRIMASAALVAAMALVACGDSTAPTGAGGAGGSGGGGGDGANGGRGGGAGGPTVSEPTAGIDGCAKIFVDPDGVCRPSSDKCKAGTIPKFDTGCVPVGISKCAAAFMEDDGLCHPSMAKCATGTYAVPSEGCVSIDGAMGCGTDTFGVVVDMSGDQHVDGAYQGGASDGSRAAPWTTIADALAHVASGGRVVVAAGDYPESIAPAIDVKVVGRCASMVSISGTTTIPNAWQATVAIAAAAPHTVGLQGLTLKGAGVGIYVGGGTIDAEDVVIRDAVDMGIVTGASGVAVNATFHHVLVDGVTTVDPGGQYGGAADFSANSTVTVAQSAFTDALAWGVLVENSGANATLNDVLVEDITVDNGGYGYGIVADSGGAATIDNSAVVHPGAIGLATYDALSMKVTDTLVEKVAASGYSDGVDVERSTAVQSGVDFTGDGLAIVDFHGIGVVAINFAKASITRTLVTGAVPMNPSSSSAGAFDVEKGSVLSVTDSAAVANQGLGIFAKDGGSHLQLVGTLIEGCTEIPGTQYDVGEGLGAGSGVAAIVSRSAFLGDTLTGISTGFGATLSLDHSLVSGTLPTSVHAPGLGGEGIDLYMATTATLVGVRVEKSHGAGVAIIGTPASISDVVVDGVASGEVVVRDGVTPAVDAGDGILVARGQTSKVSVSHAWVTGATRAGYLFANSEGDITGSFADKDQYGLVTQGTPTPTLSGDNELAGTTSDVFAKGNLSAP